jgi:hypothetical protein
MTAAEPRRAGDDPPGESVPPNEDQAAEPQLGGEPAQENSQDGDEIVETSVTINDVGQPAIEIQAAMRRSWLQELVRASLALLFTFLLFGTVAFACWAATSDDWEPVKELLQILLPAETALIGAATGFYYGTRR